jgi:multidrug transporter EmrE-like cation transporter
MSSGVFLAVAILLEITGTTALKLSDGFARLGPVAMVLLLPPVEPRRAVLRIAQHRSATA